MEHFNEVLNQDSPTDMFDFRDECELGMIDASLEDIDIFETIKALRKLKNNKAAGLDEITAELLKHGKERVAQELTDLFNRLWHADVPEEWRQGIIIPLPKKHNLRSREGAQQEDPLGSLEFCGAIHRLLADLQSEVKIGFMDDIRLFI